MSEAIETAIESNASGPKQVTVDGNTVTQHSLADQIAADKHLGAKEQARSAFPLRMNKISPPGAA